MKKQFVWMLVSAVLLAHFAHLLPAAYAQSGVELHGTVKDQTEAFLIAVVVTLEDAQGNKFTTQTDERGRYRFTNLKPNLYTLKAEAKEFKPFAEALDLTTKKSLAFDVTLQIALTEQLEVKPEKPAISVDPENNLSSLVLTEMDIAALPDDPDEMLDVLKQMAGAAGGRDDAAVYVDGFRNRGRIPPKEAILRIKLNSNPFAAEFNEPGQSRIEIITKPGADTFHGGLRFNFNDAVLNARNAFAPSKAPLQIRSYSGNLMGPIIRNRWGFFLTFDKREQNENDVVNATILNPVTLQPEPFQTTVLTPTRTMNYSLRSDYLFSKKHTIGFQ